MFWSLRFCGFWVAQRFSAAMAAFFSEPALAAEVKITMI
jgi:hypothetical protein